MKTDKKTERETGTGTGTGTGTATETERDIETAGNFLVLSLFFV